MSLFGGGFATGLVQGLAESANKALQEDIQRINNRISTISDSRVKRALEEQDERKTELKQIEDAIAMGASVYGDPNSQDALAFAAGILKEEGNLTSYEAVIKELKQRQLSEPNFRETLRPMVSRPQDAKQILSKEKIAESFLGPAKTSYEIPEGMGIEGGLIGKMYGTEKINERLRTRVKDDMAAQGLIKDEETGLKMPENYFDRDAYLIFNMTPDKRVSHYRKVLDNPNASEEEKEDAAKKVEENLSIIRKRKFDEAEAPEKVSMLKSDFLTLSVAEQSGEKGTAILEQLAQYETGQDFLTQRFGSHEEVIQVYTKRLRTENLSEEQRQELETAILNLGVEQRRIKALQGSEADKVAFSIDDAIRTGNSEQLSEALNRAREIDAANALTKNIGLSEKAAVSKSI